MSFTWRLIWAIFLLTPLREGRPMATATVAEQYIISTHAPAGGATAPAQPKKRKIFISTHAPAGGATKALHRRRSGDGYFYSRPCGRGDRSGVRRSSTGGNFYSRPCGRGDDPAGRCIGGVFRISTHAPAGGATAGRSRDRRWPRISTHAPAGGATRILSVHRAADPHFYSRPCGRGDTQRHRSYDFHFDFYSRPCGRGDRRE